MAEEEKKIKKTRKAPSEKKAAPKSPTAKKTAVKKKIVEPVETSAAVEITKPSESALAPARMAMHPSGADTAAQASRALADLSAAAQIAHEPARKPHHEKKTVKPEGVFYYGTGRRKTAIARVWLRPGQGKFSINGRDLPDYAAGRFVLEVAARRPLIVTNTQSAYDVFAKILGGGVASQIGALSHGIARALLTLNPDFRKKLKVEGLLTRDPRAKERKKYGRKRARKRFQYSKR
ncbi:MAG: 30S ribosomal protein S9 [Candidatus Margulisiibacteriota bacterium]